MARGPPGPPSTLPAVGMTLAELIVKVSGDTSELKGSLAEAVAASKAADAQSGAAAKSLGSKWALAGKAAAVGLGALALGAMRTVSDASDLNEALNKSRVTFGKYASEVPGFSSSVASSLGISRAAALDQASGIAAMVQAMGTSKSASAEMSTRILKLAADMGSFHNADPSAMLENIRSGLSGEMEPLKKYGILLSESRVAQEAVRMGLVKQGATLTDQQKLQARYSLLLRDSAVANDDFSNTSGGLANQQRILKAEITDLSASLGTALLPAAQAAVSVIADLVGWMQQHTGIVKVAAGVIAALGTGILVIVGITKAWAAAQMLLNVVMAANPFVLVAGLIAALVVAFIAAYKGSEDFRNIVNGVFAAVQGVVMAFVSFFTATLPAAFRAVVGWVRSNWPIIATIVSGPFAPLVALATDAFGVRTALTGAFTGMVTAARTFMSNLIGEIRDAVGSVRSAGDAVGTAVVSGIRSGLSALASVAGEIGSKVQSAISSAAGAAAGAAVAIGQAITNGILSGLGGLYGALKSKLESTARSVLSSLNPFSPMEHGAKLYIADPLIAGTVDNLDPMRRALTSTLNDALYRGVSSASVPAVGATAAVAATPASSSAAGGGGLTIVLEGNTLLGDSYETAERLARTLLPYLERVTA